MIDLIVAVFIWGLSFALAKQALNQFTPFELVTIRLALGAVTAFFLVKYASGSSRKFFSRQDFWPSLLLGLFEFAGTYILYTWSLSYLRSGVVGTLTLLTPTLTFLVGCLFKVTRPSLKGFAATAISFFGAALCFPLSKIFGDIEVSSSVFTGGVFFGFCLLMVSNLLFAIGNVLISKMEKGKKWSQNLTAAGLAWGAFFSFVVALFTPRSPLDHFTNGQAWILPVYLGVIATGLGFFLWNRGVQKVSAFPASLIGNFKGPLSVFWGGLLLHESFDMKFFAGLFLLLASTQMIEFRRPPTL